jgi:hypothetical protein
MEVLGKASESGLTRVEKLASRRRKHETSGPGWGTRLLAFKAIRYLK